jgi:hypothetical protein
MYGYASAFVLEKHKDLKLRLTTPLVITQKNGDGVSFSIPLLF